MKNEIKKKQETKMHQTNLLTLLLLMKFKWKNSRFHFIIQSMDYL